MDDITTAKQNCTYFMEYILCPWITIIFDDVTFCDAIVMSNARGVWQQSAIKSHPQAHVIISPCFFQCCRAQRQHSTIYAHGLVMLCIGYQGSFLYGPSQSETTLRCNVVCRWHIHNTIPGYVLSRVIWYIYLHSSRLIHWRWGNHMIAPVPEK